MPAPPSSEVNLEANESKEPKRWHRPLPSAAARFASRWGWGGVLFGAILSFYFGGYSGFIFFKKFHWFPLPLTIRVYVGLIFGIILGIIIFWVLAVLTGAFLWWLRYGKRDLSPHE